MKNSFHIYRKGFSMIEILAVMAVMGILIAIAIPTVGPLLRASNINHAAGMITDELNQARQLALTKNRDVEVRFYQLPKKSGGTKQYRALRTFFTNGGDATKSKAIGKIKFLPDPVIISDASNFSTLLDYNNPSRAGLVRSEEAIPAITDPVTYISFTFRANGGTNLSPVTPPVGNWFLTLYLEDAPKNASTQLPDNYCNVQIDPVTGRVRSYRP
jgi:uncharacterized protein (TIGR02596 family)